MKHILKCWLLPIFIIFPLIIFSQEVDTTNMDESSRESYTNIDFSYSQDNGNTDLESIYYGFSYTLIGDAGPLNDTEFLISFNRSDDKLDGLPFTDDQSLTLMFDVWANQKYSPFLFFQKSFDKIVGLQDRMNYGIGGKARLFKGFSVSYAFLFEREDYLDYEYDSTLVTDTSSYYYDFENEDGFWTYGDSVEVGPKEFFRHSIRPKWKYKFFDDNVLLDYRFYYKPRVDDVNDYLLEHELKISIATFYEALSIDLNYTNKYNSRYDGVSIINDETGISYKAVDESVSLGVSFAL